MSRAVRCIGICLIAALFAPAAGCSSGVRPFVYQANPPKAGAERLPLKVAVLAFKDGTEDFTRRGSLLNPEGLTQNTARSGWLPAELWAKALADEMSSSGVYRSVRFLYDRSELRDEDFHVEGTLNKAYVPGFPSDRPTEYAFSLRAFRKADREPFWEKNVARSFVVPRNRYDGCGSSVRCAVDRSHEGQNRVMQGMFAEAREGLEKALAAASGSGAGGAATGQATGPPPGESVDHAIERILKGK
jgi:hypothetical protein